MKTVRIAKEKLLQILVKNRETHHADYKEALKGYLESALDSLERRTVAFKNFLNSDLEFRIASNAKVPGVDFSAITPSNHLASYDTAIRKLELTVDTVVELDDREFQQLVEDRWDWSHSFHAVKALYSNSK